MEQSVKAGQVDSIGPLQTWELICLHSAQIVNAAVGPPVMASPSLLSAQWFPDDERNRATAVAILANNFGAAIGFVLPGWLNVRTPKAVPVLLYAEAALAVVRLHPSKSIFLKG